jgi:hypothetical protein
MSKAIEPVETFFNRIQQNEENFSSAYNNYNMCYINFNINDEGSNFQCSNIIGKSQSDCNDCLRTSENIILQSIAEIQNIQSDIIKESKNLGSSDESPPEITQEQKDDLVNVVNRYNTTHESLMNSVELYKTYRIQLIIGVVKVITMLAIIFYYLNKTKGVKTFTYIMAILYITLSALNVFYTGPILFFISILSFIFFVLAAIMNINDIKINYQNITSKTTETISNISNEFKKDVKVLS